MATWDSDIPSNSVKIRNLGSDIRSNLKALEQGEDSNAMVQTASFLQQYSVALIERNGRANNNDPTTEADTFFTYCKQDANAVAEGHFKDPAGNIIPVTEDGKLGSRATDLYAESIAFQASPSLSFNEDNFVTALGSFTQAGSGNPCTINFAKGITSVVYTASNTLTITWDTNRFQTSNYAVAFTGVVALPTQAFAATVQSQNTTTCVLRIYSTSGFSVTPTSFMIMAFGGQT